LLSPAAHVAQVAADLGISEQTIYVWRRQHLIDTGRLPGTTTAENAELAAARSRRAGLDRGAGGRAVRHIAQGRRQPSGRRLWAT
jgi:transposase-like protein